MEQKMEQKEASKQAGNYFRRKVQQPVEKKQQNFSNVKQPSLTRC